MCQDAVATVGDPGHVADFDQTPGRRQRSDAERLERADPRS